MSTREDMRWKHYKADKALRVVRKEIKHNRKPKGENRKSKTPQRWDDLDPLGEMGAPQTERIMPRGERERRRTIAAAALAKLDHDSSEPSPADKVAGLRGVVVEVSSRLCRVDVDGRSLTCGLRGSLTAQDTGLTNVVAVGDQVAVSEDGAGRGIVEAVLSRRSALTRPDVFYSHLQQVIVANADQLLIVAAWNQPPVWLELIDRYLIAAERHSLRPIICINKIDLAESEAACRATLLPYLDLGYRTLFASALTGAGVDELRDVLRGQTTALAGMSGVGKSSLLAAAQPGLQLHIAPVSERSHEGRHATTQVTLLRLEMGGFVVDTPGVREFGLSDLRPSELARFYPEIAAVADRCHFGDCSHLHEPGCAVVEAVGQGRISEARYHNYQRIYSSLK